MMKFDRIDNKNIILYAQTYYDNEFCIDIQEFYNDLNHQVLKVFNVKNSVNSKNSFGGTSEKNIKKMIKKYKKDLK